jgi:hypothetical protein
MFLHYFTRTWEVISSLFPSEQPSMHRPLEYITAPSLSMHTGPFAHFCGTGITSPSDLEKAGNKFKITNFSVQKKTAAPEHEFFLVTANNACDHQDVRFILERTVKAEVDLAKDDSTVQEFLAHDESMKVLLAVLQASTTVPTAVLAAGAAAISAPAALGSILIPLAASTLMPTFEETQLPQTIDSEQNSLTDSITLSLVGLFEHLSRLSASQRLSRSLNKPGKEARSDDRWLAGVRLETKEYGMARGARTFEPKNLNLLHLAILADVVHKEYPLYSMFKNNCYWFSNLMFSCAKAIDRTIASGHPDFDKAELTDDSNDSGAFFYLPFHLYLPHVAGRYLGFKVCCVERIVVARISYQFFKELEAFETQVMLFFQGKACH